MATNNNLGDFLTSVANAIRTKKGTSSPINAQDFSDEIASIQTGGGLLEYTLTFKVDGDDYAIVSVDSGSQIVGVPFSPIQTNKQFLGWALTSGGIPITYPYTPTGDTTLYAIFQNGYKATVSNLGSSSTSSVNFVKDSNFPTTFEEITIGSDIFIKIPTMYKKVNTVVSNQITSFSIATGQIDNTYQPYPCFLKEDGSLMPYILIGKYWISSTTTANSVNASASSMAIGTARTLCRAKGTGYLLYDWMIHKLWQDLIIVLKQTINTNSGTAWTTDELGIYWGTSGCWVDGLISDSNTIRFSYKPSSYVDSPTSSSDGYNVASYTMSASEGNITKLGYDSTHPFVNMPSSASGTSYTTYYCDAYYDGGTNNRPFRAIVGYANAVSGAFFSSFYDDWTNTYACRLCLRPIQ